LFVKFFEARFSKISRTKKATRICELAFTCCYGSPTRDVAIRIAAQRNPPLEFFEARFSKISRTKKATRICELAFACCYGSPSGMSQAAKQRSEIPLSNFSKLASAKFQEPKKQLAFAS